MKPPGLGMPKKRYSAVADRPGTRASGRRSRRCPDRRSCRCSPVIAGEHARAMSCASTAGAERRNRGRPSGTGYPCRTARSPSRRNSAAGRWRRSDRPPTRCDAVVAEIALELDPEAVAEAPADAAERDLAEVEVEDGCRSRDAPRDAGVPRPSGCWRRRRGRHRGRCTGCAWAAPAARANGAASRVAASSFVRSVIGVPSARARESARRASPATYRQAAAERTRFRTERCISACHCVQRRTRKGACLAAGPPLGVVPEGVAVSAG